MKKYKLIKIKKPLFTTEDGVAIYKGDKYYVIANKETSFYTSTANTNSLLCDKKWIYGIKENAEKHILFNKKCLSINDVSKFYKSAKNGLSNNSKKLIYFVKNL